MKGGGLQTCLYPPSPPKSPSPPPPRLPSSPASFVCELILEGKGLGWDSAKGPSDLRVQLLGIMSSASALGGPAVAAGRDEGGRLGGHGGDTGLPAWDLTRGMWVWLCCSCRPPGVGARWQGCGCSPTPWAPSVPMARPHGKARARPGLCCSAALCPIWVCQPLCIPPSVRGSKPGDPVAASCYGEGMLRRMLSSQHDPVLGMPLPHGITLGASFSSSPNTLQHILHLQTHITPAAEPCRH